MRSPSAGKKEWQRFFDAHAASDEYDVFTPEASARLVSAFVRLSGLSRGARVADLGCGSGVFTDLLQRAGYSSIGASTSAPCWWRSDAANIPAWN